MGVQLVFNELSSIPLANDLYSARERMVILVKTILAAVSNGAERILRTESVFESTLLMQDYPIAKWLNDNNVGREERAYLRNLATKAPFWDGQKEKEDIFWQHTFYFNGNQANGIGFAFISNNLALSFNPEYWQDPFLTLLASWLDESGELVEGSIDSIRHASIDQHILFHENWIRDRNNFEILNGNDLWEKKKEVFPKLIFCDSVSNQIRYLGENNPVFSLVINRLLALNDYCTNWKDGPFNIDDLGFSGSKESEITLQNFPEERTFLCPDGERRLFSWHLKFHNNCRLYFSPQPESKIIIIGYIGKHLRTAKYKN